jgi:hypothetical protein
MVRLPDSNAPYKIGAIALILINALNAKDFMQQLRSVVWKKSNHYSDVVPIQKVGMPMAMLH